jgi:phosphotriesterase-related protein
MSNLIWSVSGAMEINQAGIVMVHEHLAARISAQQIVDDMPVLESELNDLLSYGCRTVIEMTNIGMGRDVRRLKQLAQKSGVNIIASTGFYVESHYPDWLADTQTEELTHLMVTELEQGIEGSDIRAGVIGEIGSSQNVITPNEYKVFRAAARAHLQTGRPISTHTSLGTMATEQANLLEEEGVDLQYVTIGHLDLTESFDTLLAIARRGAFIQFDTFGKNTYQPDEVRMERLLRLVDAGFCDSIMVSVDISRNEYMKAYGGFGYDHFLRVILPELRKLGLDDGCIHKILEENPRRFLKGKSDG